ncbi:MAG: dephospho-CoA kinase, partial [Acidimicrobiia bacterium]
MSHTVLVLTGGIGSGKSTVAGILAARGADVIEADRLGHAVLAPDGAAHAAVVERWPEVATGGAIDRRALGRIVFGDP